MKHFLYTLGAGVVICFIVACFTEGTYFSIAMTVMLMGILLLVLIAVGEKCTRGDSVARDLLITLGILPIIGAGLIWGIPKISKVIPYCSKAGYYAFRYSVPVENVLVEDKPEDCDWDYSPLGNKGCHYESVVTIQDNPESSPEYVTVKWERVSGE
jgi:hypothetical protein